MSVENSNGNEDSEREEGEIVELCDLGGVNTVINDTNVLDDISSEEEFELRERIAELEARNLELEKIASISNTKYDLKCARDQQNLDILNKGSLVTYGKNNGKALKSSSDTRKRRRRRSKRKSITSQSKREQHHRRVRSSSSDLRAGRDSSRRLKKRKRTRYSSYTSEDSDGFHLYNRKELEAALFRGQTKKLSPSVVISDDDEKILDLRLKALQSTNEIKEAVKLESSGNYKDEFQRKINDDVNVKEIEEEDDEQKALEEQELRLIALKSAYIKKFEVRKRKKLMMETRPYSPTDDVIHLPVEIPVVNLVMSTDYSDNNMDISPINTPPREPDESYYRPVDMDLAFSGNSNSPISYVQKLFADDLLFKDNLIDDVMSESKDEEEVLAPCKPPITTTVVNEAIMPNIVNNVPTSALMMIDDSINQSSIVPPKLQTQKSEDTSADISLEADCLRSLLLSNLNKNRSKRAKENACPEPTKTISLPIAKKKVVQAEVVAKKPLSPTYSPLLIDCYRSNTASPTITEISNNIIQASKRISNSNSPNTNPVENSLLKAPIVNKLIIHLGQSSSPSDEDGDTSSGDNSSHESDSDLTVNRRLANNEKENTNNNHNFQEKLDQYLKTVRSKLNDTKKDSMGKQNLANKKKTINLKNIKVNNSNLEGVTSTPVAVRHLPLSSQLEYKQLISRMKLLEKQKSEKMGTEISISSKATKVISSVQQPYTITSAPVATNKITTIPSIPKTTTKILINPKKVVDPVATIKSSNINSLIVDENEKLIKSLTSMNDDEKIVALNQVESNYSSQSAIFLDNLDSLVELIRHAQTKKINQVKLEQNILETRKKLKSMETELTNEKANLKNMYPKIFSSHKKIIEDRKKCRKYDEFCLKIGKLVKGEDYKSPSDKKSVFIEKIKTLSDENKKLKDINIKTIQEIEKKEDESKQHPEEEALKDNSKKTNYISPLEFMKPTTDNILNPNGVLCPFELTGKCEDSQCQYEHLTKVVAAVAATVEPASSK